MGPMNGWRPASESDVSEHIPDEDALPDDLDELRRRAEEAGILGVMSMSADELKTTLRQRHLRETHDRQY